jgi:hypothetical protein
LAIVSATHDIEYFQQITDTVWNITSDQKPSKVWSSNTEDFALDIHQNFSQGMELALARDLHHNKIFIDAPDELKTLAQQLFRRHAWDITKFKTESDYCITLCMNQDSHGGQIRWSLINRTTLSEISGNSFRELVTGISRVTPTAD